MATSGNGALLAIGVILIVLVVLSAWALSSQIGGQLGSLNGSIGSISSQLNSIKGAVSAVANNTSMKMEMNTSSSMQVTYMQRPAGIPNCSPITVPISGSNQVDTYYVSANYTGKCYPGPVDSRLAGVVAAVHGMAMGSVSSSYNNTGQAYCNVVNGIAVSGYCEPVTIGYQTNASSMGAGIPTEEWFKLANVTLAPGQFVDLADTTPFFTLKGHMAAVIPCSSNGNPEVVVIEGVLDGGVATVQPITPEYLQQLSNPAAGICVYHFDIGATGNNPEGSTDFALLNIANKTITLSNRNTVTMSVAEGYLNTQS